MHIEYCLDCVINTTYRVTSVSLIWAKKRVNETFCETFLPF